MNTAMKVDKNVVQRRSYAVLSIMHAWIIERTAILGGMVATEY